MEKIKAILEHFQGLKEKTMEILEELRVLYVL